MAYTKNTWTDRVSPLSATRLNNLETQYDQVKAELGNNTGDLWTQIKSADGTGSGLDADLVRGKDIFAIIEKNFYDDYLRTLELYYTGHFSGNFITGLKGMMFDGFVNTTYTEAGTAVINTTDKIVKCGLEGSVTIDSVLGYKKAIAATWETIPGLLNTTPYEPTDLSAILDHADSKSTSFQLVDGTGEECTVVLDMGTSYYIKGLRTSTTDAYIGKIAYSKDKSTWTAVNVELGGSSGSYTKEHIFSPPIYARYIAIQVDNLWGKACSVGYAIPLLGYKNSVLTSTTRALQTNVSNINLYLTKKLETGTNIVPYISNDGGATWNTLNLYSSRTDPLLAGYVEDWYKFSFSTLNKLMKVKFNLTTNTDRELTPLISRYGIQWE